MYITIIYISYVGQWVNDLFHGEGVYIFANGERFNIISFILDMLDR